METHHAISASAITTDETVQFRDGTVVSMFRRQGDVEWTALRSRGAEWSWLTPDEALTLARSWLKRYAPEETNV